MKHQGAFNLIQVVYLDFSKAALDVAKARAEVNTSNMILGFSNKHIKLVGKRPEGGKVGSPAFGESSKPRTWKI